MWAVQTCFLKDFARTQQNTSPGQKWPSVVSLCSLHETGHSSVPWRIVAILCMSQNKPLQGQELEVWKMMYSEFTSPYKGSPVWAVLVLILPCVHFAVMIVVCGCQAAKAETIFKNVCVMSPAQGNEPLGNHAQMQRKPKILKSWTVSFLLRIAWVGNAFWDRMLENIQLQQFANQPQTLISTGSSFSLLYVN